MRFVKRVRPGETSQRWKHAEELEIGMPMEEPLVSVEAFRAQRAQGRYHSKIGLKGKLSQLPEGKVAGRRAGGFSSCLTWRRQFQVVAIAATPVPLVL